MKNLYQVRCNIAQALNLLGDKWTLLILHELYLGSDTFGALCQRLPGIPSNLLSERLRTLEGDGLLCAALYSTHPPRYRYTLTASGADLGDVFNSLLLWGERNLQAPFKTLVHKGCGGPVRQAYICERCGACLGRDETQAVEAEAPQPAR